jgi:hypothetical protein
MSVPGKMLWKIAGKPDEKEFRRKLPVFIICLLVSALIWSLIKLSRTYEQPFNLRLNFVNQPENAVIAHLNDTVLRTQLRAEGFRMLLWQWQIKPHQLTLDLAKLPISDSLSDTPVLLELQSLHAIKLLSADSKIPSSINRVFPEQFKFMVSKRRFKKVPVIPELKLGFAPQYRLYSPPLCTPDSVEISGAATQLDRIEGVYTKLLTLKRLKNNVEQQLTLKNQWIEKGVLLSESKVQLKLEVESFTESDLELPLIMPLFEDGGTMKAFPETVKVVFQVAVKDFKSIEPGSFEVRVVYPPAEGSNPGLLLVEVVKHPENVQISRIIPEKVEYVLLNP